MHDVTSYEAPGKIFSQAPQRTRRIAILGFGRTVVDAPVSDPTWELWGMNGFHRAAEPDFGIKAPEDRYGLWFDMHTLAYTREYGVRAKIGDAQERWLEAPHPFTVLSVEERPEWPSVKAFPIEYVVQRTGRDYFTSTIAYALALALTMDDVAEVGLWGVDLAHDTEYADQRPCAEYWIGRCEAAGIVVTIHERSALLRQRARYGYEVESPLAKELRAGLEKQAAGLEAAIAKHMQMIEQLRAQASTDDGALQVVRSMLARLDVWQRGGRVD